MNDLLKPQVLKPHIGLNNTLEMSKTGPVLANRLYHSGAFSSVFMNYTTAVSSNYRDKDRIIWKCSCEVFQVLLNRIRSF